MYIVQAKIYVGKSETSFNIMLNNHPNDVYKVNKPKEDQHFKLPGHNFNQYAIFNLTEQLNKNELGKEPLTLLKKSSGHHPKVKWEIVKKCLPYSPQTKRCLLCLNEKLEIAAYKEQNLWNKRNEIVLKCRHQLKYALARFDTKD